MTRKLAVFLLLLAAPVSLHAVTPQIFPDDYKPSQCQAKDPCATFDRSAITNAGARMQGYTNLRETWINTHIDKLQADIKPYCTKLATCYGTLGNTSMFCNDVVLTQMMSVCDQWPQKSDDHDQCFLMMRTYATGIDLKAWDTWTAAQECAKANATPGPRQMELIVTPKTLPLDFDGKLVIYALDKETRVPLRAIINVEGEILYAREAPDGITTTSYALPWKASLRKVTRADGHSDIVPPKVTVTREGYETITFPMPLEVRPMVASMTPAVSSLKRGKNKITVTAIDSKTGKPVDARVMIGEHDVAEAGQPFELDLKKGEKREEIWVRSSFERYSDVVVAPAKR
ncbi:MAG: hypothetical protein DMF56_13985 [Acidobacteria bacterium]|nr:MAG: hypothetical protein DMF56_13985 [Acidobacteriota bacterium]